METVSKGDGLFFIIMSTIKEFSSKLYSFHKDYDTKISTFEKLISTAKREFFKYYDDIDVTEFVHVRALSAVASTKKSLLREKLYTLITKFNHLAKKYHYDQTVLLQIYDLFFDKHGRLKRNRGIEIIDKGKDFYRIRGSKEYKLFKRKDLFVIADDKENLVGKYRFNTDGNACLYLADNLYLAWEECRRPDFSMANFARFENTRDLNVIRITIPAKMATESDFLMSYFALLCSSKANDDDKHRYQYEVPNLFMEMLKVSCSKGGNLDGIHYLSSRRFECEDFLFNAKDIDNAYVFLQREHKSIDEVCPKLKNSFIMTKPRTHFLYKTHRFSFDVSIAYISNYQHSMFYQIENQLKKESLDHYDVD